MFPFLVNVFVCLFPGVSTFLLDHSISWQETESPLEWENEVFNKEATYNIMGRLKGNQQELPRLDSNCNPNPKRGRIRSRYWGLGKSTQNSGKGYDFSRGSQLTCREQTGRKPSIMTVSLAHWPNPTGSQRGSGPIDMVHKTQHPETQSRAEKFGRWIWREQVKHIQMALKNLFFILDILALWSLASIAPEQNWTVGLQREVVDIQL